MLPYRHQFLLHHAACCELSSQAAPTAAEFCLWIQSELHRQQLDLCRIAGPQQSLTNNKTKHLNCHKQFIHKQQRYYFSVYTVWWHNKNNIYPIQFSTHNKFTRMKVCCHDHTVDYRLTCNLNTVLIVWIHLAQFIQLFLCNDSDISPVSDILSLLKLYVDFNIFKKIFQVLYSQALPQKS